MLAPVEHGEGGSDVGQGLQEVGETGSGSSANLVMVSVMQSGTWLQEGEDALKHAKSKAVRNKKGAERQVGRQGGDREGDELGDGLCRGSTGDRGDKSGGTSGVGKPKSRVLGGDNREKGVDSALGRQIKGQQGSGNCSPVKALLDGPKADCLGLGSGSGKPSPIKLKKKGPMAGAVGPGCCWGPSSVSGGQAGDGREGTDLLPAGGMEGGEKEGGSRGGRGKENSDRGSPRVMCGREKGAGGQGVNEGIGKGGRGKGQGNSTGVALEVESPVRRERTRSPVKSRGREAGGKTVEVGNRGKKLRQPIFSHGTLVSKIQQALTQNANDDNAEATVGEEGGDRGQASPGEHCDK